MTRLLIRLYVLLLFLYPRYFHREFGDEMVAVFTTTMNDRAGSPILLFLRELRDLPGSVLAAFTANWLHGGKMTTPNEYISPSSRRQAFIGALPFLIYGIVSLIGEMGLSYSYRFTFTYPHLAFYGLALIGLLIGWIRGFPLWSYSYLGWSLVFAWWWTNISISAMNWGYRVWIPFSLTVLIALLWTRSLAPIKKLIRDTWNDWTRLSLAMYALGALIFMSPDENHHPDLLVFMLVSILVVTAGVWFFLRSASLTGRVLSIAGSFLSIAIIGEISYLTWDWRSYYGLPPAESWIEKLGISPIGVLFWLLILFWPAPIALLHRITVRRTVNP